MHEAHFRPSRTAGLVLLVLLAPGIGLAGFSVDESPRETPVDPGDVFLPGLGCEVSDGDFNCPPPPFPTMLIPFPDQFDLDAFAIEVPLEVCPAQPPIQYPGILFSIDDGDPGPQPGAPDNAVEMYFYDHCRVINPLRGSYATTIRESALGLGGEPPPVDFDDDVDAYETRPVAQFWSNFNLIFSPDFPSTGGLVEGNIYWVNPFTGQGIWGTPASLGIPFPDQDNCDIDGIAPVFEPQFPPWQILFTTDANAPCGLDPGDIYVSDNNGQFALYADDVVDLQIAESEQDEVDVDALAINTEGDFQIIIPEPFWKADWPNYAPSGMPDFSQNQLNWPPTWCGPTALLNSFQWFDSEMECDRDRTSSDPAETEPNNDSCPTANRLGEESPISAFLAPGDTDWYEFEIPFKRHADCEVTISTCALRNPGDADTTLSLFGDCAVLLDTSDDDCLPDLQSEIEFTLPPGSYAVAVTSDTAVGGPYTISLGIDCHPLILRAQDVPDDHSPLNPARQVPALAACMNTDNMAGTGPPHLGTFINDMQTCIDTWLANEDLDDSYTEVTVLAPTFEEVATEIEHSEDVILLLGFYWELQPGQWIRCGGHYVTSAGVDRDRAQIFVSDPAYNYAEPPPAGFGGPGRVRGLAHGNHAPTAATPSDHDDAQNVSHDGFVSAPSAIGPPVANWSITGYATSGTGPTLCAAVERWCAPPTDGQNPIDETQEQLPCPNTNVPISVEVEAMVDVSPVQTPLCIELDPVLLWPENLVIGKGPCPPPSTMLNAYDLIRGKLCNLRFATLLPFVDLGSVQCVYNNASIDKYDELSPDQTECFGGWFYLMRQIGDAAGYGAADPSGSTRVPAVGGCP